MNSIDFDKVKKDKRYLPSLYCKKVGSSMIFKENGCYEHVTILSLYDSSVALQDSSFDQRKKRVFFSDKGILKKPQRSFVEKVLKDDSTKRGFIREIYIPNCANVINFDIFDGVSYVDITGSSKGKGFSGTMKKYNFKGLRASHGVSLKHRSQGSTGQCQDPGRVNPGKKMAGQMGFKRVTVQNIKIISFCNEKGSMIVKGSIPGFDGSRILVSQSKKKY